MSLRRFLTLLIWLCVLPMFVLAAALAAAYVADLQGDQHLGAQRMANNAAAAVDNEWRARISALQILADSPRASQLDALQPLYQDAKSFHQHFGNHVTLSTPDGRMLLHTAVAFGTPLPSNSGPADGPAVLGAVNSGAPSVGDVFIGTVLNEPLVAISVPVVRDGTVKAVIACVSNARQLARVLQTVGPRQHMSIVLRDSRGDAIARVGPTTVDGEAMHFEAMTSTAPWRVVLDMPRSEFLAPVVDTLVATLLVLLTATLTALLGGHWASQHLSAAVQSMVDTSPHETRLPIDEVETARQWLHDAAQARTRAEADRQAVEAEYRQRLERTSLALQTREAQLRGIFDAASEAVITTNAAQLIVMANRAAAKLFGYRVKELVGLPLSALLPERHRLQHQEQMRQFGVGPDASRTMSSSRLVTGLRRNGEEVPLEAAISHVHIDGRELFTAILRDITERLRAQDELKASHEALHSLIGARDRVQEDERRRIARELHDDLQQTLAAVMMEVAALRQQHAGDALVAQAAARIGTLASTGIASTRRIVNDLRPQLLEELGLVAALETLAAQFASSTGVTCRFDAELDGLDDFAFPAPVATCLFRVAQEALNNVTKHANARNVRIRLERTPHDMPRLRLRIQDDGRGLAVGDLRKPGSFGVMGMAERVRAVSGVLHVSAPPEGGTLVDVELDLPPTAGPVDTAPGA